MNNKKDLQHILFLRGQNQTIKQTFHDDLGNKKRVQKDTGNYDLLLPYGYLRKMFYFIGWFTIYLMRKLVMHEAFWKCENTVLKMKMTTQHLAEAFELMAQDMTLVQNQLYAVALETIYQSLKKSKELAWSIAQF